MTTQFDHLRAAEAERAGRGGLWRRYSADEDRARTNVHYEQPPEFFTTVTGGEWNVYSCNLWDGATDDTGSQERKLDLLADLMRLEPGQRILDVGCGWAGPLTYLAKRYGVRGVGLTLSPMQKRFADERIARHGVDVTVHECHWQEYTDPEPFDAVYTDEVIVHFNDLLGYFLKVKSLLRPGGRMLNKELHFSSTRFMEPTRAMKLVNEIYGETGNYRTLHEELALVDEAGFTLDSVRQIDLRQHYVRTIGRWEENMRNNRERLEELVGPEHYRRFYTYLRIAGRNFTGPSKTLDVVTSRLL